MRISDLIPRRESVFGAVWVIVPAGSVPAIAAIALIMNVNAVVTRCRSRNISYEFEALAPVSLKDPYLPVNLVSRCGANQSDLRYHFSRRRRRHLLGAQTNANK